MPVTPQNMSYVSVVCTGLVGFVIALRFTTKRGSFKGTKRGSFKGSKIDLELLHARRAAVVEGVYPVSDSHSITNGETSKE
jgi:choline transport protein